MVGENKSPSLQRAFVLTQRRDSDSAKRRVDNTSGGSGDSVTRCPQTTLDLRRRLAATARHHVRREAMRQLPKSIAEVLLMPWRQRLLKKKSADVDGGDEFDSTRAQLGPPPTAAPAARVHYRYWVHQGSSWVSCAAVSHPGRLWRARAGGIASLLHKQSARRQ